VVPVGVVDSIGVVDPVEVGVVDQLGWWTLWKSESSDSVGVVDPVEVGDSRFGRRSAAVEVGVVDSVWSAAIIAGAGRSGRARVST